MEDFVRRSFVRYLPPTPIEGFAYTSIVSLPQIFFQKPQATWHPPSLLRQKIARRASSLSMDHANYAPSNYISCPPFPLLPSFNQVYPKVYPDGKIRMLYPFP